MRTDLGDVISVARALRGDGGGANQSPGTTQGLPLKNAKERMDVIAATADRTHRTSRRSTPTSQDCLRS
jgi:hypothetical protein